MSEPSTLADRAAFLTDRSCSSTCSAEELELRAVRSRFCSLVADWRLTQGELRPLLGLEADWRLDHVIPDALGERAETAMRLLLRLDAGLGRVVGAGVQAADWLRTPDHALAGEMPVVALSNLHVLRAVVRAAEHSGT